MKLYHGSTVNIEKIDLAKSKPNKDFGPAFYLSVDEQQALELAQFRAEFEETDRIGAQITRFKQGYITFDEFLKRIHYIKGITFQYAFCTQMAVDKLIKL